MTIRAITEQAAWTDLVRLCVDPHVSLFQSWEWGEVQQRYGRPVYRYVVEDHGHHAAIQFVVMPLGRGRHYLFSPRGPVTRAGIDRAAMYEAIVSSEAFRRMVDLHRAVFWRMEPMTDPPTVHARRVADMQPTTTLTLNLEQTEDQLLAGMKQKTRYNVRLADKRGVSVSFVTGEEMAQSKWLDRWWELLEETSGRHGIRHHEREYYQMMFTELGDTGVGELAVATVEGTVAAMNLNAGYGDTYTYIHGASSHAFKKAMAPYALQWASIQRARAAGHRLYDFYGIAPEGEQNHKMAGVTRFKTGFGGTVLEYPGTYDFAISGLWYTIYRTVKRLRS